MAGPKPIVRSVVVFAIVILALVLFPQTIRTMKILAQAGGSLFSPDAALSSMRRIGTQGAGEEVLPPAVRSMLHLIREQRLGSYRHSAAIASNEEIRQRLLESSLPVRYHPDSNHVLLVSGESVSTGCKQISAREGIVLAHCP